MIAASDLTPEAWRREFEVNVGGVVNGARAARLAFAGKGGAIVNIASNAGKVGFPNMAAYNASKAAVINLTRSLAREWAPESINVNAVCPGSVATPMLREVADQMAKEPAAAATSFSPAWSPRSSAVTSSQLRSAARRLLAYGGGGDHPRPVDQSRWGRHAHEGHRVGAGRAQSPTYRLSPMSLSVARR